MEVMVKEVVRAVDVYLFKYNCPKCTSELFTGKDAFCVECGADGFILNLNEAKGRNIVAIPDEKRRKMINKRTIDRLRIDQENKCAYCFRELVANMHVDHITPISVGGTNNYENLALSCARCNLVASNTVFESFWEKQKYVLERIGK